MVKRGFGSCKGQVTIFLIVGIVVLLVFGLIFFFNNQAITEETLVNEDLLDITLGESVDSFVSSCLKNNVEEGLIKIGHQGGYYQTPINYSIIFLEDLMPYYYLEDETMIPTLEQSELELEKYLQEKLPSCLNNFSTFKDKGYEIVAGELSINVDYDDQVKVDLNYPLTISKGLSVTELNYFNHKINLNFKKFFSSAQTLIDDNLKNKGYVCMTCMDNLASQEYINIESYPIYDPSFFENDIILFRLQDKETPSIGSENFTFEFIMEYLIPEVEEHLEISEIDNLQIKVGESFNYQVTASRGGVSFSDNTALFEISPNGLISFTPNDLQKGVHFITIFAEDGQNNKDQKLFKLEVI